MFLQEAQNHEFLTVLEFVILDSCFNGIFSGIIKGLGGFWGAQECAC